jgi:hypothetical protein
MVFKTTLQRASFRNKGTVLVQVAFAERRNHLETKASGGQSYCTTSIIEN